MYLVKYVIPSGSSSSVFISLSITFFITDFWRVLTLSFTSKFKSFGFLRFILLGDFQMCPCVILVNSFCLYLKVSSFSFH